MISLSLSLFSEDDILSFHLPFHDRLPFHFILPAPMTLSCGSFGSMIRTVCSREVCSTLSVQQKRPFYRTWGLVSLSVSLLSSPSFAAYYSASFPLKRRHMNVTRAFFSLLLYFPFRLFILMLSIVSREKPWVKRSPVRGKGSEQETPKGQLLIPLTIGRSCHKIHPHDCRFFPLPSDVIRFVVLSAFTKSSYPLVSFLLSFYLW